MAKNSPPFPDSHPKPRRVLIVEDNQNLLAIICELLVASGHFPFGVASAEEALVLLKSENFDVLLTDVRLPGISGIDLALKVNQRFPAVKIIIASGYSQELVKHINLNVIVLPKPYDLEQLQKAMLQI